MPWMMQGAMMGFQAIMGAQQAGSQAAQQMTQTNWSNHIGQMQTDQANRDIAAANARQWMNNKLITETANRQMAEEQVYLQYNFDNATGELSRKTKQQNDSLISSLSNRNLKGGTARALMRQTEYNQGKMFEARSISHGNRMRDSQRRRDAALSQRNFSYTPHQTFVKSTNWTDPGKAHKNALISGLIGAGLGTYNAHTASQQWDTQSALIDQQTQYYTGLNQPPQQPTGGGMGPHPW